MIPSSYQNWICTGFSNVSGQRPRKEFSTCMFHICSKYMRPCNRKNVFVLRGDFSFVPSNSSILLLTLQEKPWTLSSLKITQRNQWLTGPLFEKTGPNMNLWSGQVSFSILIVLYLSLCGRSVGMLKVF